MTQKQIDAHMPTPVGLMVILIPLALGVAVLEWVRNPFGKKK